MFELEKDVIYVEDKDKWEIENLYGKSPITLIEDTEQWAIEMTDSIIKAIEEKSDIPRLKIIELLLKASDSPFEYLVHLHKEEKLKKNIQDF